MTSSPAWLLAKPFAHRGLFGAQRPENSLSAIDAAIDAGFPVEIDVQVSADGRAVVFHDWNLLRLTGVDARVVHLPAAELTRLPINKTSQTIPFLEEALDHIAGRQPVLLEVKNRRWPTALEPEVARLVTAYEGQVGVHSFNPYTLGWFRHHHPKILRGQISCAFDTDNMHGWKKRILEHYGMNWMTRPHFISHHWERLPALIPTFLRKTCKLPLLGWTIRSPEEFTRASRLVDNVIFEGFVPGSREGK